MPGTAAPATEGHRAGEDAWVWLNSARQDHKRPAPGRGRPGGGPTQRPTGRGETGRTPIIIQRRGGSFSKNPCNQRRPGRAEMTTGSGEIEGEAGEHRRRSASIMPRGRLHGPRCQASGPGESKNPKASGPKKACRMMETRENGRARACGGRGPRLCGKSWLQSDQGWFPHLFGEKTNGRA